MCDDMLHIHMQQTSYYMHLRHATWPSDIMSLLYQYLLCVTRAHVVHVTILHDIVSQLRSRSTTLDAEYPIIILASGLPTVMRVRPPLFAAWDV